MTSGVAPRASIACTLRMSDDQTTLSAFADGDGAAGDQGRDDAPTPAENAADIERLIDLVGELTDQVGTLVGERTGQDTVPSIDTEPAHAERMFQ